MSSRNAVAHLQDARDALGDDVDLAHDLDVQLADIADRARALVLVEDVHDLAAVEDVDLEDVFPDGTVVTLAVHVTGDLDTWPAADAGAQPATDDPADEDASDERDADKAAEETEADGDDTLTPDAGGSEPATTTAADDASDASDDTGGEPGEDERDAADLKWCGRCGADFTSERGVKIHNGRTHDADDAIVLDDEPSPADLTGDVDDQDDAGGEETDGDTDDSDVSWDAGDDADGADADGGPLADDDAGHKYSTGEKLEDIPETDDGDASDDETNLDDLDVPVDADDVRAAAENCETLDALGDAIGVRDRALVRVIAHRLNLYGTELGSPEASSDSSTGAGA